MSKENSGFEGVWIPKNLYFNQDLSWSEKILLLEIDSLDRDRDKGCFAGNKYLATRLGKVKPASVANMISKLKQSGWIIELWTDGRNRRLRVDFSLLERQENEKQPSQNYEGASQKNEASSQNYEALPENDTNIPQNPGEPSQKNDDFSPEPSQKYEASDEKPRSEPSQKNEHSNNKGFSTKQLENTHSTAEGAGDKPPPEKAAAVCVDCENPKKNKRRKSGKKRARSEFSLADCLRYAEACKRQGENILNPKGLATQLHRTGEADAFIKAMLYPEKLAEDYPPPVEFTDEPCRTCFGAKIEIVAGMGARPCLHCFDERGSPTGKEPKGDP